MSHHILVVDDEPDIEALISQKFRREIRAELYRFTFVGNGQDAYQQIVNASDEAAVDMVLTDINMPVMDGLALLAELTDLACPPKTVVMSAYSDMTNIRTAMNRGAFDFVTKPINFQDLVITINKTLKAIDKERWSQQQLEKAKVKLVQGEKMSALGQMVAGVAHEINTPVNFIYGNLKPAQSYVHELTELISLYQRHYPEPVEEIQSYTEEIDLDFLQQDLEKLFESLGVGASRIRELVLYLRNFSRLDESDKKDVDIHEGIDSTLLILGSRLKGALEQPEIKVIREYGELPRIACYPSQLNQVVMNLLANAIDALSDRNKESDGSVEPGVIRITTKVVDDDWVRIAIADNGPGISEEVRAKLFDPFFTTKPVGKGTGLGLSISYQIVVDKHQGRLSCESSLGEGTTFVIELPLRG
ncbi:MAG: ATP-binding protein [Cyanobacteria bacterium P01_D01_bin.56]